MKRLWTAESWKKVRKKNIWIDIVWYFSFFITKVSIFSLLFLSLSLSLECSSNIFRFSTRVFKLHANFYRPQFSFLFCNFSFFSNFFCDFFYLNIHKLYSLLWLSTPLKLLVFITNFVFLYLPKCMEIKSSSWIMNAKIFDPEKFTQTQRSLIFVGIEKKTCRYKKYSELLGNFFF